MQRRLSNFPSSALAVLLSNSGLFFAHFATVYGVNMHRFLFSFFSKVTCLSAVFALVSLTFAPPSFAQVGVTCRDPVQQPFAADSPWNRPIGASAQFVPANFKLPTGGFTLEENVIIMENKGAPMKAVQMSASKIGRAHV